MQHFKSKDLSNGCGALSEAEILASVGHVVNYPNTPIHPDTVHLLDDISSRDNLNAAFKKG